MARLAEGHLDSYEPGTRRERGYICGISSIYKDNCIEDAATVAANAMNRDMISSIEVYTQDAEFDLDDLDELV